METKDFLTIIDKIAEDNNTTPDEVYREMQYALTMAAKSKDQKQHKALMDIPHEGDVPTPFEVVSYISQNLSKSACVANSLYPL